MPELGGLSRNLRREFLAGYRGTDLRRKDLQQLGTILAKRHTTPFINNGSNAVVFEHRNPTKVTALDRFDRSPLETKMIFYVQNTFAVLFPHNFPHFYASFSENSTTDTPPQTVRERINGVPKSDYKGESIYPFFHVLSICDRWDIPLREALDHDAKNFQVTSRGEEFYMDLVELRDPNEFSNVLPYMDANYYSDADKKRVTGYLQRMRQLSRSLQTASAF